MRNRRLLPNWLDTFQKTFENTEAPEKYVYWIGVGAIGAALQRNVVFNQITFKLYANHYIILVGPPAVKKTTAINFGVDRLRKVEGVNVGPSSVTWQYLVDKLKDIQTPSAEEMAFSGDISKDSCPIVLPAGELGTLIDFDERSAIDFFTNAWDSPDVYDKGNRTTQDQLLSGPCVTIIAGTTPQWIKDNVHGSTRSGGFISRCIMPYAGKNRKIVTYPDENIPEDHAKTLSALEHDLACIASMKGEYKLTADARALGKKWHQQISIEMERTAVGADSDNWVNRRYPHVHKLAMVLAASKRDELIIEKEDLQEAIDRVQSLAEDFNLLFAMSMERNETKGLKEVERLVQTEGEILLTDVYTKMRQKFTKKEIIDALDVLLKSSIIARSDRIVDINGQKIPTIVLVYKGEGDGARKQA